MESSKDEKGHGGGHNEKFEHLWGAKILWPPDMPDDMLEVDIEKNYNKIYTEITMLELISIKYFDDQLLVNKLLATFFIKTTFI
jgi:hypothetical protein